MREPEKTRKDVMSILKKFYCFIRSIEYKERKAEAWMGIKYLLVLGYKRYNIPHVLGEESVYQTDEFETKQEALSFLDEHVSKSDRKLCRLYKEISLSSSHQ